MQVIPIDCAYGFYVCSLYLTECVCCLRSRSYTYSLGLWVPSHPVFSLYTISLCSMLTMHIRRTYFLYSYKPCIHTSCNFKSFGLRQGPCLSYNSCTYKLQRFRLPFYRASYNSCTYISCNNFNLQLQIYIKSICGFCAYSFSLRSRTTLPSVSAACSCRSYVYCPDLWALSRPIFNLYHLIIYDSFILNPKSSILAVYLDIICRFLPCGQSLCNNGIFTCGYPFECLLAITIIYDTLQYTVLSDTTCSTS